jgi:CHAT domain-containing protein
VDREIELRSLRRSKLSYGFDLLIALSFIALPTTTAHPILCLPSQAGQQEVRTLAPREPVERELSSSETHSYRLALNAGQYLRVEVEQRGIDVAVKLFGSDGREIASSNLNLSRLESVSLIAETAGEYRFEVRAPDPKASAGRYVVRVAELRAAIEQDRNRVSAERAFEEAERLRVPENKESRQTAVKKYEEALALYRALGERRGEAFTLWSLGTLVNALGERRKSLAYLEQSLPLMRAQGEKQAESHLLLSIGTHLNSLEEKQRALEYFDQALALARAVGYRSQEAQVLFSISIVHTTLGDRLQSVAYQEQALAIWRLLGNRQGEASALSAIGGNYEALGEKQKAVEYLLQALPLLRSYGSRHSEAQALYILGLAYDSLNERQKAVEVFGQALEIRKAIGHRLGDAANHNSLGAIYEGLDDLSQAMIHYKQSLALYEQEKDLRSKARMLRNIGLLYDKLGEKRNAAEHFQRALPLFRLGADRQTYARLLTNLGKVLSESGEHQQALTYLNEALPLLRRINHRFFELHALYWIARSERERGNLALARATIEEAIGLIESMRSSYYQPELRSAGFSRAQEYYELEMDLLLRLAQSSPDPKLVAAALETSERARARTLLDLLAEARIEVRQGITPELKQRERVNQSQITAIQHQLIQAHLQAKPDQSRITTLQSELKQAEQQREQLELEIRRQYPRYAELQYPTPLSADAIRGLLDEQTALLQYALGGESSFLFVATREAVHGYRLPKATEITALAQEVREKLSKPGRREFGDYAQAARRLYDLLIAPAETALAQKKRLLIAPDQTLYYLPFESLLAKEAPPGNTNGYREMDFLIKRWDVGYVPSASVLASLRQNKREPSEATAKQFLAFADPVYQSFGAGSQTEMVKAGKKPSPEPSTQPAMRGLFEENGRWELQRLAESQREAMQIAQLYPPEQARVYLGLAAKEENVKNNASLSVARRIHFATHGLMSERQPQYSGLALTLDEDPGEDGLLQVYEIFNLKLQADLVVLSACQTGLGKELRGEGMIGLTRAFMYAGAPSVVVSLWQVADRSTAELMVRFYRQLDRTGDKIEALRRAKLELMQNPRYSHPYFWASFVLVGEPK